MTKNSHISVFLTLDINLKSSKLNLINLLNQYFSQFSHNAILVNKFSIGSLFRHKDTLNKGMRSEVVYKFSCPECGAQYVGSTTQSMATRTAEHAGVSVRTGRPLSQLPQSHIRDHLLSCNGPQDNLKHIDIIGTCQNKTELRILESLHILQSNPTLNCMQSAHPLNIIKWFFMCFIIIISSYFRFVRYFIYIGFFM